MHVALKLSIYSILRRLSSSKFIKSKQCFSFYSTSITIVNHHATCYFRTQFSSYTLCHSVIKKKQQKKEKIGTDFNRFSRLNVLFLQHDANMSSFYCCHKKEMFKCICKHTMRKKSEKKIREGYYQSGCLFDEQPREERNGVDREI